MANPLVVPAPVRTLALYFLIGSIVMILASAIAFFSGVIIFGELLYTPDSVPFKGALAELILGIGFFLVRWGMLHRKRWAYYACCLIFFPSLLNLLIFRSEDNDWTTRRLKHPETQQWFFG
jgi:hypothetical protein